MSQNFPDPVVARLIFGELARQYREEGGFDTSTADAELGGYPGKLSKVENGTLGVDPTYVDHMIMFYNIHSRDADDLRAMAAETRRRTTPSAVTGTSRRYVALERVASDIRMVYNEIPGLLQTAAYAHAALSQSPSLTMGEVATFAQARQHRGDQLINRHGPHMWIVLGIEALYREVGGVEVLHEQLVSLTEIAEMPRVHLRIAPWSSGCIPALSCPFTLLYIKPNRKIAYVSSLTRPDYIRATGTYEAAFDHAWDRAACEVLSAEILKERITALS